jgi:hypothetical protein
MKFRLSITEVVHGASQETDSIKQWSAIFVTFATVSEIG